MTPNHKTIDAVCFTIIGMHDRVIKIDELLPRWMSSRGQKHAGSPCSAIEEEGNEAKFPLWLSEWI